MADITTSEPSNATVDGPQSSEPKTAHTELSDLAKFKPERVLFSDSRSKSICAVGSFEDYDGPALIYLEKTALDEDTFKSLCSNSTSLKQDFVNDIYGNYQCFPAQGLNGMKALVIHPATEKHINKYDRKPVHIVNETPELYETVTLPHLNEEQFKLDWVFNVLEHKREAERIFVEDKDPVKGFLMAPDLKWDGIDLKSLYCLAIVHPRGIKSLRDLTNEHLPLLENILNKGSEAIFQKYELGISQQRIFIHYQPSFYHLHVHFTYLFYDAPGIQCGKAHLLTTVINNIKLMPDYYQKATLPFTVGENDRLFTKYCEKGILQPAPKLDKAAVDESELANNDKPSENADNP